MGKRRRKIGSADILKFQTDPLPQFTNDEVRHITLVLPIVGLDIETISSGNSAVLWFGA